MEKTPEFIYGRVVRKYEANRMKDVEKYPSLKSIGEFSKFDEGITSFINSSLTFEEDELPIILCWIKESSWALITTKNFVSCKDGRVSQVPATECEGCWPINSRDPHVKTEGAISPHAFETKSKNNIEVDLPSGSAAIAFEGAVLVLCRLR